MLYAPAVTTGFPPNVEPCEPAPIVSLHFSPMRQAPKGSPPATPFAVDTTSGVIP